MELKDIIGSVVILVVLSVFAYFGEILNAEKSRDESEQEEDKRTH